MRRRPSKWRVKITEFEPAVSKRTTADSPRANTVVSAKTFVWSANSIAEERDSTGANVAKRFFGEGEQRTGGADAGNYYYSLDHLGSIREVTDSTGSLKAQYDYDAWGNSSIVAGTMNVDFGFTGHYFHQPSGLNLATYCAYDPNVGRWINRDPIGEMGGLNLYGYVQGTPVTTTDHDGLFDGETSRVHYSTSGPGHDPRVMWNHNRTVPTEIYLGGLYYHNGRADFRFHGNWGGPGWANGGWGSESGPLPAVDDPQYVLPKDPEDPCYEQHDRCIHDCPTCPSKGNACVKNCDARLADCLWALPSKSLRVRITAGLFDSFIPFWIH